MSQEIESGASVVIPTVGRTTSLQEMLASLERSPLACLNEIVVVGDGVDVSSDVGFTNLGVPVRLMKSSQRVGANRCRDIGVNQAISEYIVLLDDDVLLSTGWSSTVAELVQARVIAATGPVTSVETSVIGRAREVRNAAFFREFSSGDAVPFFAGGNGLVRRDILQTVGGFGALPSANGLAKALNNLGTAVCFSESMQVSHVHDRGARAYLRHGYGVGLASGVRVVLHRTVVSIRPSIGSGVGVTLANVGWALSALVGCAARNLRKSRAS